MGMKGNLLMMALMAGAMSSYGYGNSGSRFDQPILPEEKKRLPGKFKGVIPKGCKLHTEAIETKWRGFLLTKNVDIVYGSEKAKQKAIVKAGYEIKEYLKEYHSKHSSLYIEFDKVEELIEEVNLPLTRFVK